MLSLGIHYVLQKVLKATHLPFWCSQKTVIQHEVENLFFLAFKEILATQNEVSCSLDSISFLSLFICIFCAQCFRGRKFQTVILPKPECQVLANCAKLYFFICLYLFVQVEKKKTVCILSFRIVCITKFQQLYPQKHRNFKIC